MFKTKSSHAETKPNKCRDNPEGKDGTKHDVDPTVVVWVHRLRPFFFIVSSRDFPQLNQIASSLFITCPPSERRTGCGTVARHSLPHASPSLERCAPLCELAASCRARCDRAGCRPQRQLRETFHRVGGSRSCTSWSLLGFRVHLLYERGADLIQRK